MVLLACLMLEDEPLLQEFNKWPLHITLVPWYEISNSKLPEFLEYLENTAKDIGQVKTVTDKIDYFGRNRNIMVRTIQRNDQLERLHKGVLKAMDTCGECVVSKCSTFRPHVSVLSKQDVGAAELLIFKDIYLVARNSTRNRQVVAKIQLPAN